jgi:cell division inhibitor SepF
MSIWQKTKAFIGFEEDLLDNPEDRRERTIEMPSVRKQRNEGKVLTFPGKKPQNGQTSAQDMVILAPQVYEDSLTVASYLKRGNPVIVNIKNLDNAMGKRFIDFICGSAYAFDGNMHRLGGTIFLFTPAHMGIVPVDEESTMQLPQQQMMVRGQSDFEEIPEPLPQTDQENFEYFDPMQEEMPFPENNYASIR